MKRLLLAASMLSIAAPALAERDFAITNATVALGDGGAPIEHATVIVRGGKIVSAGAGLAAPAGIQAIDGSGKWVTPGLFATVTDLGLYDVDGVENSRDITAGRSKFSAALDIAPVINPLAQTIKVSRAGGVTRATVAPRAGNAIFAGQGAVIDLDSNDDPVIKPRAFQYVELGENGSSLAGGSRTAAWVEFRNALAEASDLAGRARTDDALLNRPDAAALIPVVSGTQTLYVHVERAADILAVIRLKADFPKLDLVIAGATEGWMVAKQLAAAKIPVIATALNDLPAEFEQLAATQSNVGRMVDAGVKVAIGNFSDMNQPRHAPQQAGNLVALTKLPGASGLSWGQALAAITSIPAEISGMGGHYGVLKPGAAGDVVIWDGDPLELSSAPQRVFIDGIEQPMDSHQTKLRERYATPAPGDLPKAYEW
ncbi:MAG: amidohydrolase family protein [Candidatus Andeanibacterium colombiense]|uniref:Amidohydrolase family protein n=1 Tax=Candidatus Andeanibacterium colombiense TaxID=3121345 RepID=A0AAJ5X6F0_9SPHN|nr:MAG: amidohydrolase family protein [Sphingomonadaceae bacterium]